MIDAEQLRQLGWSNELIDEVMRVAEPMRQTYDRMNQGPNVAALNYCGGDSIFLDQSLNGSSQTITVNAKP